MLKSKYFLVIGATLTIGGLFITYKKKELENIINRIKFELVSIGNFNISFKKISMTLKLNALNATSKNLYINTGFVNAKILRVYDKKNQKLLAFSKIDTNILSIPSGSFYQLPPINIDIPLLSSGIPIILEQLKKENKNFIENFTQNFSFELDISVFNKIHTLKF